LIKGLVSGIDASTTEGLEPVALQLGTAERIGFDTYLNVPATRIIEITENYGFGTGEILGVETTKA